MSKKIKIKDLKFALAKSIESLHAHFMSDMPDLERKAYNGLIEFQNSICDFQDNYEATLSEVLIMIARDTVDPENDYFTILNDGGS